MRLHNFIRFGTKNNSVVFDISPEDQELINNGKLTLDELYDRLAKNPLDYINKAKARGITNLIGIAGVVGDNYDESNGVGKSSLLEGICYVHYEKIVRRNANTDKIAPAGISVVTKINGKFPKGLRDSYVEEFFEEGGKIYRAKRGRTLSANQKDHSPILEVECYNLQEIDYLSGHRKPDSSEFLASITPMDYDLFCSSAMFGQSDAGKFLIGTDKTRKEMLISLLKIEDVVSGYLEHIRNKKNAKDKELVALNAKVEILQQNLLNKEPIEKIESKILKLKESIKGVDAEIKKCNNIIEELSKSEVLKIVENIREEGKKVREQLESQKSQKDNQTKQWKMLAEDAERKERNCQSKAVTNLASQKQFQVTIETAKKNIEQFDLKTKEELLIKVKKAKKAKPQYTQKIKDLQAKKENIVSDLASESSEQKRLNKEVLSLKEQLQNAGDKSEFVCDKCKSKVNRQHIESEIKKNEDLKNAHDVNIVKLQEDQKGVVKDLEESIRRLDIINDYLIEEEKIKSEIKDNDTNKQKIEEYSKLVTEKELEAKNIQKEIEEVKKQKDSYKDEENKIAIKFDNEINNLNEKINGLKSKILKAMEDAESVQNTISARKKDIEVASRTKSDCDSQVGTLSGEIENIKKETVNLKTLQETLERERLILNRLLVLEDVFGLEGIQTRIVNKYLPLLNVYIKECLDILSNGKMMVEVMVNDKSKIDINISGGTADSFVMLSGGEKMLIRLATDIGLARLSFTRCAQKPEIICLDEVFGPLDEANTQGVFRLLNKLQNDFGRVMVISHKQSINKMIKHQILIEKQAGTNGLSEIRKIT